MEPSMENSTGLQAADDNGTTALHQAVSMGNVDLVQNLIRSGETVDVQNEENHTPLQLATIMKNIPIMKILIDAGANMRNFNIRGNTGAHHAAFNGNCDVMEVLVDSGMDVNCKNMKGHTLLHFAAREGHKELVQLLINKGAQINVYNNDGQTPLLRAAYLGRTEIVKMLLEAEPEAWPSQEGLSFIHTAASGNRLHTIQSVFTDFPQTIRSEWISGGDRSASDCASSTGGCDSTWWLRKQMISDAEASGPSTSSLDYCRERYEKSGSNVIERARKSGWREPSWLKKSVIDGQIELHYMNEEGNTALHAAVEGGNEETVERLIEVGALLLARNHANRTPIDIANRKGTSLRKYLPADPNTRVDSRISSHLYSLLLSIIAQTAGLDVGDSRVPGSKVGSGNNLDRLVQQRKLEVTKIVGKLLMRGTPQERLGSCDRLILPLAITTNNRTLLPILLAAGFPLTTTDSGLGIVQLAWLTPDITIWVGMVVTRAVINQLKWEIKSLHEALQDNCVAHPFSLDFINILIQCVNSLIADDLSGEKPWEAQFKSPDNVSLTELYITACTYGATLTAWYIWKAGGSNYSREHEMTALEAALSGEKILTAFHLVLDMDANPFLRHKRDGLLIDHYPEKFYLLEVLLGKDYRGLDKMVEKFKDKDDKRDLQKVILLLIVLFLQYTTDNRSNTTPHTWQSFFGVVLKAYYRIDRQETLYSSSKWMLSLCNVLENEGVEGIVFKQARSVAKEISKIYKDTGLDKTSKKFDFDGTDDNFYFLFTMLRANFLETMIPATKNFISEKELNVLEQKALKLCCDKPMPLFLHLLTQIAKPDLEIVLNNVCKSRPLHHAAKNGNSSAIAYLLECGVSPFNKDRSGILPIQYACMFGHRETGSILTSSLTGAVKKEHENLEHIYSERHTNYLKLYGLNLDSTEKSRYLNVHSYEELLTRRFDHIKNQWQHDGVQNSAAKILVSYTDGEPREIKDAVALMLKSLTEHISSKDEKFEGEIDFVGSSEDNVRLYCPDEYDCNLLLKNISAYPDGGIKAELTNLDQEHIIDYGHRKSLKVQPVAEDVKELMRGTGFLDHFYNKARESLSEMNLNDDKFKIMMPGIKRTQVGINLSFLWLGKKYPMLFVDIDFVPTVKAPWPVDLPKPICNLDMRHLEEVYLNNIGEDEWRLSFGPIETKIMRDLTVNKRYIFLACKMILAAFKTESWVPLKLKNDFMFWNSRMFSLHSKGGFALKNCFFQELEQVTYDDEWAEENILRRACSVFERMCLIDSHEDFDGNAFVECPKPVMAYFGGDTEKASIYLCAPEIVKFLRDMKRIL